MNISLSTHRTLHAMLELAQDPGAGVSLCIGRDGTREVHVHRFGGSWEVFDLHHGKRLTWGESEAATEAPGRAEAQTPIIGALKLVPPAGEAVALSGEGF
jgi:hypothetical protein